MNSTDVVVIGGGIVGLATAFQLLKRRPDTKITIIEKESRLGEHQTGHNSGVLHSGIYYKPGSLKATNCREGKLAMQAFCEEHSIDFDICGKVIVAVDESERPRLEKIKQRGDANGVQSELIGPERLKDLEPHARGVAAIHVPEAGIVNYRQVCQAIGRLVADAGNYIALGESVSAIEHHQERSIVRTQKAEYEAQQVVNCGGLHCDRLTTMGGGKPVARIVPFRGEYYELRKESEHLCRNLIYPVPDPSFPFLGVHFTRMIEGGVECGPNAVLAFAREGYRKSTINCRDLLESLTYGGFVRMALKHWKMGMGEMWRSFSKRAFVKALQRLMPEIQASDLSSAPAGVRAQAVLPNGGLVDDFVIVENERMININNAPSPAATASLNIGRLIVDKVLARFDD